MFYFARTFTFSTFVIAALMLRGAADTSAEEGAPQANVEAAAEQAAVVAPPEAIPLAPGDMAVSGFSGVRLPGQGVAPGVNPLDKTVINVDEPSLRVFDLTSLGAAPAGQVINPAVKFAVPARDIGQVYAIAIDAPADGAVPNLFAAATSAYGLNIVAREADKDGVPVRLDKGAEGASFMAGQFGGLPGSGPGVIFKIDGATGVASVFAATDIDGVGNSGAGLAALAVDTENRSLFAADLDTGLIHRFDLDAGGASAAQFDHGALRQPAVADDGVRLDVASPSFEPGNTATWGMTAPQRRVTGLAVHDNRLFYGVAAGPEIWSVALNADGTFDTDPRLETSVTPPSEGATVQSIVFDATGNMIVGLRAAPLPAKPFAQFIAPQSGKVLRFSKAGDASSGAQWSPTPDEYAIGAGTSQAGGNGGVALAHGYNADGTIDLTRCDATLAATGDGLSEPDSDEAAIHGVQLNAVDLVRPANTPAPTQSALLDFDAQPGNKDLSGSIGAVAAIQRCAPGDTQTPEIAGAPDAGAPGAGSENAGGEPGAPNMAVSKTRSCQQTGETLDCTFSITAQNTGATPFDLGGATFEDRFSTPPVTMSLDGGGETATPTGFTIPVPQNTVVPAGGQSEAMTLKATFKVPPEGMTVVNCASLVPAGMDASDDAPAPPNLTPEQAAEFGLSPEEAQALAKGDQLVFVKVPPTGNCVLGPDGLNRCTWDLSINNFSNNENVTFVASTSVAPSQIGAGLPENAFTIDNPPKPGSKETKFAVQAGIGAPAPSATVTGTFPGNGPPPTLTVEMSLAELAKAKAAGVAPIALDDPSSDGTQSSSTDSDPADNTSCVTFDTNNPQDPGTPTNEPTLPQSDDTAQNDPNNGGGGTGSGDTPPLPGAGNLSLAKTFDRCFLLPAGQRARCDFTLTITNTGQEPVPLAGVTTLTDKFSVKPIEIVGLGTDIVGAVATPDGLVSTADGVPTIAPGSMTLPVRATFDVPPGGLVGENCAELTFAEPGSEIPPAFTNTVADSLEDAGPVPAAEISSQLDRGVRLEGEATCVARGAVKDCTWTVTVENPGTLQFPLEFIFETQVENGRVVSAAELTAQRRTGKVTAFESQIPVPPKTARSVKVTATLPNDGKPALATVTTKGIVPSADKNTANNRATSIAGSSPPAELAGTEPFKGDSNAADNRACTPFSVTRDGIGPGVNLDIVKKNGSCGKSVERNEWICGFAVDVINRSDKPFNEAITLSDVTNFKTQTLIVSDGTKFQCDISGGPKTSTPCTIAASTIPPGGTVSFSIDSRIPFDAVPVETPPGECVLRNTIAITSPRGIGSQESTALATLDPGPNRGKAIPCDPPALELAKTAQGCTPTGDGFDCKFQLAVKSVGPDPFDQGDIHIFEQLPDNAKIKMQSADWKCDGEGFVHCKLLNTTLLVNETAFLDLVVAVPKASVKPGQCEISNTARLAELGRPEGNVPASFVATAAAKIDSPECAPKCPPGQKPGRNGSCEAAPAEACIAGWKGEYPNCCPSRQFDDATGKCGAPPPPVACSGGMVPVASTGYCECPRGQTFDSRGRCYTPTVAKPELRGGSTNTAYVPPPPPVRDPPVIRDLAPDAQVPLVLHVDPPRCPRNHYPVRQGRDYRCYPYTNQNSGSRTDDTAKRPPTCPDGYYPLRRGKSTRCFPKRGSQGGQTNTQTTQRPCPDGYHLFRRGTYVRCFRKGGPSQGGPSNTQTAQQPVCPDGFYPLRRGVSTRCFPKGGATKGGPSNTQTAQSPCPRGSYRRWRGRKSRCVQDGQKAGTEVVKKQPQRCGPNEYAVRRGTSLRCLPKRGSPPPGQFGNAKVGRPDCPRSYYPVRTGRGWRCIPRGGVAKTPDQRKPSNGPNNWRQQRMHELAKRRWRARQTDKRDPRINYGSSGSSSRDAPVR